MTITVNSNAEGTDYCLHNLSFKAYAHNPHEPGEFFVLRADDKSAKVTARLFFQRNELEQLREQIDRALEQGQQTETGIKVEACTA